MGLVSEADPRSLPERAARRCGTHEALYFQGWRWSFTELSRGVVRLAPEAFALVPNPSPSGVHGLGLVGRRHTIREPYTRQDDLESRTDEPSRRLT